MVKMSKVYLKEIDSYKDTVKISQAAKELAKIIQKENKTLDFSKPIPLKVTFGEEKCITFIEPKNFEELINWLKEEKNKNPEKKTHKKNLTTDKLNTTLKEGEEIFYIETNTVYKGRRTTRSDHVKLAKEHGFTNLPIIIADGEAGEENIEIDISNPPAKHYKKCKIGKSIAEAEQMVVLTHFKGHILPGFGGAIKQLSMGCASRSGKLAMHSNSKPIINPLKCKKCFTCTKHCPTDACIITTIPHIDGKKCIGCAKCLVVCPFEAISPNWLSTMPKEFIEKMAEYALAAQKSKKIIYINFVLNITKECDCMGKAQKPIAKDIGVLASTDPVAIDKASLDLIRKSEGKKMFGGDYVFEYGEKIGLGKKDYELVEIQ